MTFVNLVVLFGTVLIIAAFFVAINFRNVKKPSFYKYIALYILLGILISANTLINYFPSGRVPDNEFRLLQELFLLFQLILLGLFFLKIFRNSSYFRLSKRILFISISIQAILIILLVILRIDLKPNISSSLFLLFCCFFYIKDILNSKSPKILVKSSSFWIVMGIFFHSGISFPVCSLIPFIPLSEEYRILRSQVFSIYNLSLIVFYALIIKSYLCLMRPLNSY